MRWPVLIVLWFLCLTGCSAARSPAALSRPQPSAEQLAEVPVHLLSSDGGMGSAVHLGHNRLITCRHVLHGPLVGLEGELCGYRLLAEGREPGDPGDWVIIELNDLSLSSPPAVVDFEAARPQVGQEVYLIGYPGGDLVTRGPGFVRKWQIIPLEPDTSSGSPGTTPRFRSALIVNTERAVVRGQIIPRPMWHPRGLIYVKVPREIHRGFSGGALVYYDPADDRLELLGVLSGAHTVRLLGIPLGHTAAAVPFPVGDLSSLQEAIPLLETPPIEGGACEEP